MPPRRPDQDAFQVLSDEVLNEIIVLLPADALQKVLLANRRLYRLARSESHWQRRTLIDHGLAFKTPYLSWRENYYIYDTRTCTHLNSLASTAYMTAFCDRWQKLFATASTTRAPAINCNRCPLKFNDLWLCMDISCFALGCSRSRNRHAIQHSIQHTPRVISMKLNTLEMWCYVCEKWIGTPDSPQDERAFVVDWQTRLLMSSANLSCAQFPIDKSTQLPILSRNLLGYPLPPVTSLWYAAGWNERRQREREIPFTLENDPFCFVAQSWMRAWSEFLLGNAPPPGPVDNSSLVVPVNQSTDTTVSGSTVSYQLRSDIQPDIHFWIISTRAWTVIEQFYGGGPHLGEKDLEGIDYNELLIYMASIREQIQEDLDINHSDEDEEEEEEEEEADRHSDEDEQIIMLL